MADLQETLKTVSYMNLMVAIGEAAQVVISFMGAELLSWFWFIPIYNACFL